MTAPAAAARSRPEGLPPGCAFYSIRQSLIDAKDEWLRRIIAAAGTAATPSPALVAWILGRSAASGISPNPMTEAAQQRQCLLRAMINTSRQAGSPLHLASRSPAGLITARPRRTFDDQRGIWDRKWFFEGAPFDAITARARTVCGARVGSATRWNPRNPDHRACWNPDPRPGRRPRPATTPPHLTADEKQNEILQASSAPGVSRHHWGSDFDFADLDASHWSGTGAWTDEATWLANNARFFGFTQAFTATSVPAGEQGYMAEPWHWSYWPVAEAVVEFILDPRNHIRDAVEEAWDLEDRPRRRRRAAGTPLAVPARYQFVDLHWEEYVRNVTRTAPMF